MDSQRRQTGSLRERMMREQLRIVVTGYILRWPLGGNAWPYLQYVLGLARMGHEVYYVEESGESPYCCYDVDTGESNSDPSYGLRFTSAAFDSVGLGSSWAYYDAHQDEWHGPCASQILGVCRSADLLLRLPAIADFLRPWLAEIPVRALIDTDPVFTQLRHLRDPEALSDARRYNAWFSFGENIFRGTAQVPDDGLPWRATRQPVVLDAWKVTPGQPAARFTSVLKWESYRDGHCDGVHYGMKAESFAPYMDLPQSVSVALELAVGGDTTPKAELKENGWVVQNPVEVTRDLWSYQDYIRRSTAEFSIAKSGYVVSRSGWFSERSAVYLASGRPVVAQDTGFGDWLETGSGIVGFATPKQAITAIEEINTRYAFHCNAARELATEYFDATKVLAALIDSAFEQAR